VLTFSAEHSELHELGKIIFTEIDYFQLREIGGIFIVINILTIKYFSLYFFCKQ